MWTSLTLHFASMVDCVILQKLHYIHNMAYIYQRWMLIFCDKFPVVWTFLCCEAYPKEVGPFDHMCLGTKRWWWVRVSMKIDPSKRLPEHTRPKFTMLERVALPLASMTPYVYVPQAGCVCVCVVILYWIRRLSCDNCQNKLKQVCKCVPCTFLEPKPKKVPYLSDSEDLKWY